MLVFQSLTVTEVKHDDKLILQKATSQLPSKIESRNYYVIALFSEYCVINIRLSICKRHL